MLEYIQLYSNYCAQSWGIYRESALLLPLNELKCIFYRSLYKILPCLIKIIFCQK